MSAVVTVAGDVVALLNDHSFSRAFTAARHYAPQFDRSALRTLQVAVVPKGMTTTLIARRAATFDVQVDVAVLKKLDAITPAEIDPLMALVEEIAAHVRFARLAGGAVWVKTEYTAIYSPEQLEQLRQFTAVLTLTFRMAT